MNPHDNKHDGMHDDPAFDEYLKRDSALSRQYQNSSTNEVPPELDQKILAQARAAIDNKVVTHPSWWIRWNKPLALAATLMLAFTVVYRAGHQSIEQLAAPEAPLALKQKDMPSATGSNIATRIENEPVAEASAPSAKVEAKKAQAPRPVRAEPHQNHDSIAVHINTQLKTSAPPPIKESVPAPVPALSRGQAKPEATNKADAVSESGRVADSINAQDIGELPETSVTESMQRIAGVSISRSSSAKQQPKKSALDPEQTLRHIRDLRKQGKQQQADKAWQQFQKDFPDYPVAKDDAARNVVK